jgi:hypothetical protein
MFGLWGVLALEEGWSWAQFGRRAPLPAPRATTAAIAELEPPAVAMPASNLDALHAPTDLEEPDEAICQQLVRRREADGGETLAGWLRAVVPAAARHATAHVAICPPFEGLPACFAEQMDGPPARIKVAQVLPHGVRFEIKLDEPCAQACDVLVEFSIRYGAADTLPR